MHGDVPSIVPRRNYDIRTQCLKGTCSSSELPGRWHVSLFLDAVRPCRGCSSMLLRKRPMEGRLRVPLVDRIHCSGFPDGADDGVRTRDLLLGKQACCHCTTSALPCFFRIRRTAVTHSPPSRKRDGWSPSRIDRIRTCDPMLPKHVRYQTAPQSDIFDRTPWLTSYVRALLNAISSDSGTVLSQYHDAFILILSRV